MAIPRFFDRIADATLPLFEGVFRHDFHDRLAKAAVTLQAPLGIDGIPVAYAIGFLVSAIWLKLRLTHHNNDDAGT